jgi:glutamate:GABA antiporter
MATVEWRTRNTGQNNAPAPQGSESLVSEEYVVKTMPSILGKFDMVAIYLMIIFYATNAATAVAGGAAAFTYLLIGAVSFFIPCVIAAAQLGVMFPHEGSLYNWTHKALGGYWSFFVAFCAWFPGVLVMISAGDVIASYLNGLNANWLTQPWQQGVAIIVVIVVATLIAVQRFRTVQNTLNVAAILTFVAVFLIGAAGVAWLLKGHHSMTDFSLPNWGINGNLSSGNIYLFGLVTLAYLGMESPLNMGGEISSSGLGEGRKRKIITGHFLWGTILVLIGYFVVAFGVLAVEGQVAGSATTFSLVQTVSKVLGSTFGFVTAICLMTFFIFSSATYTLSFARLLLVAGIDQRLPVRIGRLNKNRVPSAAIKFQAVIAIALTAIMFFVVPYVTHLNTPANLSTQIYNIMLAASTLVWAFSTMFLFINLLKFYQKDPRTFRLQLIFPVPVLWLAIILGSLSCIVAIVGTLFFPWTTLISNGQWWYIIGGLTIVCLIIAAIGSMLASSEAAWQNLKEVEKS